MSSLPEASESRTAHLTLYRALQRQNAQLIRNSSNFHKINGADKKLIAAVYNPMAAAQARLRAELRVVRVEQEQPCTAVQPPVRHHLVDVSL